MRKNSYKIVFIFLFAIFSGNAQESYFVIARNGLLVRDQPSSKGKVLDKLEYRAEVEIIENTFIDFKVNEDGYIIPGTWVQIDDRITGESSYVFSGFLKSADEIRASFDVFDDDVNGEFKEMLNVYPFTKDVYGIVIPVSESDLDYSDYDMGYLTYRGKSIDETIYLKSDMLSLFKNKTATKKYNDQQGVFYHIYGTKGTILRPVEEVLFYMDDVGCHGTYVVLTIPKSKLEGIGKPILASKQYYDLEYTPSKKATAHYNHNVNMLNLWVDCMFDGDLSLIHI